MKNFTKFINIVAVAAMSILVISCDTTTKNDYQSLIPANSSYVASFNINKLEKAANLTKEQKAIITNNIDDFDLIKTHFDFKEPAFLFMTSDLNVGLVAKIKDTTQLAAAFGIIKDKLNLDNDKNSGDYSISYNDFIAIAYNENSFLILVDNYIEFNVPGNQEKDSTLTLIRNIEDIVTGKRESFTSTQRFKELISKGSDISTVYNLGGDNSLSQMIPSDETIIVNMFQDYKPGKIAIETELKIEGSKIMDILTKYSAKPDGKFDEYIPSDYILYTNGAVSTKDLDSDELKVALNTIMKQYFTAIYSSVGSQAGVTQQIKIIQDASTRVLDNAIATFDGEFAFTINSLNMIPEVVYMAEVKSKNILDSIINYIPSQMVSTRAEGQYIINATITQIEMGVKDNVFYIINSPSTFTAFNEGKSIDNNFKSTPFAKKIKGTYGGFDLQVARAMSSSLANMGLAQIGMQEIPVISKIENLEAVSEELNSVKMNINMKDKSNNALHTIMTDIIELIPVRN